MNRTCLFTVIYMTILPKCMKSSINIIIHASILSGTQNYSGMSVFRVSPSGGAITSAGAVDITVTFHPDHESLHYRDLLTVQLMNKVRHVHLHMNTARSQEPRFIFACGLFYSGSIYIIYYRFLFRVNCVCVYICVYIYRLYTDCIILTL